MAITVTENALTRISTILEEDNVKYFRMGIQGGGCSGFAYKFDIANMPEEDDTVIYDTVLVDPMSYQYLDGSTLDFEKSLAGAFFKVTNPQASSTCGCGSSFTI